MSGECLGRCGHQLSRPFNLRGFRRCNDGENEGRDAHGRDGGGAQTAWTTPEPAQRNAGQPSLLRHTLPLIYCGAYIAQHRFVEPSSVYRV